MMSITYIISQSSRIEKTYRNTPAYSAVPSSSHTAAVVAAAVAVVEPLSAHSVPPELELELELGLAPALEPEQLVEPAQQLKPGWLAQPPLEEGQGMKPMKQLGCCHAMWEGR